MCGRYALALSNEEVYDALENQLPRMFERGRPSWERQQDYRPNYNVAPRQRMPVIRRDQETNEAMIETMQWGLIPHWTKHPPTAPLNTINARSEALLDSSSGGMWHALKGYKRCIVPAQGLVRSLDHEFPTADGISYYEWQKKASSKVAHFTRLPLSSKRQTTDALPPLMFFAGLWDRVKFVSPVESRFQPSNDPEDKREPYPTGNPVPLSTFTILTTSPPKDFMWLHDRMPCMLTGWDEIRKWLDLGEVKGWVEGKGGTGEVLKGMSGLECYPVPPEVGKIGNNSPTFIQPVAERSDGIKSFFQKQTATPAKGSQPKPSQQDDAESAKSVSSSAIKKEEPEVKVEGQVMLQDLDTKVSEDDDAKGLGDDSNAPNPESKEDRTVQEEGETPSRSPSKRKRQAMADEEEEPETKAQKRGGHRTKVVRRASGDDSKKDPAITSFFKSPVKSESQHEVGKTRRAKRGSR